MNQFCVSFIPPRGHSKSTLQTQRFLIEMIIKMYDVSREEAWKIVIEAWNEESNVEEITDSRGCKGG